jgi:hypothetical protein
MKSRGCSRGFLNSKQKQKQNSIDEFQIDYTYPYIISILFDIHSLSRRKNMTIERCPHDQKNPYAQINRNIFTDPDLSWESKGLLAYFISLPNDWKIKVPHLVTLYDQRGGGEKAIYRMINELIDAGYCTRIQKKGENGLFGETIYHISEFKKRLPHSRIRDADNARAENGDYNKEEELQKNKNNNKGAVPLIPSVVVSSFIDQIEGISPQEKKCLMKYPEDRVKLAIQFNKTEPPTTTKIQQLIWHCQQEIPPNPSVKAKKVELYEKLVQLKKKISSPSCELSVTKTSIWFIHQGQGEPKEVKFSDTEASTNIKQLLLFYKFVKTGHKFDW